MVRPTRAWRTGVVSASILAVALLVLLTACGGKPSGTTQASGTTAKAGLSVAQSALSTMAPDAKLLLVQTAQAVTPTSTPIWSYLMGSPASDKTFLVYVRDGKAMGASEYGKAGLGKDEWKLVPGTDQWQIDSNAAYQKAVDATKKSGADYGMGMLTYVPKAQQTKSKVKPFVWYVSLQSGTSTASVQVDAKTGTATISKE